eukprot:2619304-Prymnesium_polylepis.1
MATNPKGAPVVASSSSDASELSSASTVTKTADGGGGGGHGGGNGKRRQRRGGARRRTNATQETASVSTQPVRFPPSRPRGVLVRCKICEFNYISAVADTADQAEHRAATR